MCSTQNFIILYKPTKINFITLHIKIAIDFTDSTIKWKILLIAHHRRVEMVLRIPNIMDTAERMIPFFLMSISALSV